MENQEDIDILTGKPRQLSKGQLKKLKEAASAQQTKPEDKKAEQVASVVLTIDEEAEEEEDDEEELMELLAKTRAKKQAKENQKVAQAREEIAKLQEERDKTTQEISMLRDKVGVIDGKIASIRDKFKLNPIQGDDDSQDDSVAGAGPTPTIAASAKQESDTDGKWKEVCKTKTLKLEEKETDKQVASSGAVKMLEILEIQEPKKLGQFYLSVFPNGKKPCVNAYVVYFLELLRVFGYITYNPAKGCEKANGDCLLCKNHNLNSFFKKVEIGSDKFFKCLNLFDALINSQFKFYGVNITVEQHKFYQELVENFHE